MTWIKFFTWLLGLYTAYYAVLILWDQLRHQRSDTRDEKHELTFVEDVVPQKSQPDENLPDGKQSPVVSSGGVTLKEFFNLAREEVVEYTRAVSF
ncbi:hypothetical protein KHS38_14180 [Mucilaginibacter sp. Bleaf8]|uniref:hypothetical protein n=1 Tax=Mucilaginibacter sp. Bleaf8 TaxID=2834430 RepID=UPI001BCEECF5|nr:hypothetical protein [Mucilaginibacter sp. Bleaf8]MBS7565557.1 hypothetical protein [Mucilaginibacter sp. Bleaf8]